MNLFTPPIPNAAPDVTGLLRNRGAISAMAQVAEVGNDLSRVGRRIESSAEQQLARRRAEADEWRRRQDEFALDMASIRMKVAREKFSAEQERRTDLGTFNKDKVIGFDQAITDYDSFLGESIQKEAENLPDEYADMWLERENLRNQEDLVRFENVMIGLRTTHNAQQAQLAVRDLAMGDEEAGVPPDPDAALSFARRSLDKIPDKQKKAFLAQSLDDVAFSLINHDPKSAQAFLKKAKSQYEPERWRELSYYAEQAAKKDDNTLARLTDQQKRKLRLDAVGLIDARDPSADDFIRGATGLVSDAGMEDAITQTRLSEWSANRDRVVETDLSSKLDLIGKALSSHDDHDFRMELAKARYDKDGKLSDQDYEAVKGLLAKEYPAHEAGTLKAGYDAIRSATTMVSGFGGFGGWSGNVPHSYKKQDEATKQLISWFDARRDQNNVPDPIETVTYARKLMAVSQTSAKPTEIPKEEIAAKLGKLPKIETDADYDRLASGSMFLDPNGKLRKKP